MQLYAIRSIERIGNSKVFVMAESPSSAVEAILRLVSGDARAYSDKPIEDDEHIITTHDGVDLAVRPL